MARRAPRPSFQVELRPAAEQDYGFAEHLYVQTMRPLLQKLGAWDETDLLGRFKTSFDVTNVRIIRVNGMDAGFMQISETETEINIDQIHLLEGFRSQGIGSRLIGHLQRTAITKNKPLSLAVIRGNPALALYQRLGFVTVTEDVTKLFMRSAQTPKAT
jgi:ribosomal protein S18 acetylase RimI-like enzyme